MAELTSVSRDALQDALADVTTGKAATRLIIALAYKDGVSMENIEHSDSCIRWVLRSFNNESH